MPQLRVVWKSSDKLQLTKPPGIKSWSIFVGVISLGIGATLSGEDCLLLRIAYILGCFAIGICFLEDWEDCIFDKSAGQITLQKENSLRRWFRLTSSSRMVLSIGNVMGTKAGTCSDGSHQVQLILTTGVVVPLIESRTTGSFSDHNAVADTIRRFLGLERVERLNCKDDSSNFLLDSSSLSSSGNDSSPSDTENEATNNDQALWTYRDQVVNMDLGR